MEDNMRSEKLFLSKRTDENNNLEGYYIRVRYSPEIYVPMWHISFKIINNL